MIALFSGKLSLQSDIMAWRRIKTNIYFAKKFIKKLTMLEKYRVFNMVVSFDTRKNNWYFLFNDRFQFHESETLLPLTFLSFPD